MFELIVFLLPLFLVFIGLMIVLSFVPLGLWISALPPVCGWGWGP